MLFRSQQGVDYLFAHGELAQYAVKAFGEGGTHFEDINALCVALRKVLAPEVTLLVKGSRFMQMERVVEQMMNDLNKEGS